MKRFIANFNNKKVYYDPAFQRREAWDQENINNHMSSLTKGWALSPIVVAAVTKCKEHSALMGNSACVDYFSDALSRGYEFISLDGQNRTKGILKVFDNKVTLSGEFLDADGQLHDIENTFYRDLPQRLQDKLADCVLTVKVVENATREDLSLIFRSLNDGKPLNDQELRQAMDTPIADFVRQLSFKYSAMLNKITSADHCRRMIDDENIAKIAMVLMEKYHSKKAESKQWGLSKTDVDNWYRLGVGYHTLDDPSCPYLATEIERVKRILTQMATVITHQTVYSPSRLVPKKLWWATVLVCAWMEEEGFEIRNNKAFFEGLKAIDDDLAIRSEQTYTAKRVALIGAGTDPDLISKQHYYFKWQTLPHQVTPRTSRRTAMIAEVKKAVNLKRLGLRKKASAVPIAV
tara:strand:+ start:4393 stop:5607 length:1215 start_codon:yes stop_codon:yes gene_type:complete